MPLTKEQKDKIINYLKEGKKPSEIADIFGIKRQAMGSYVRDMRHLLYKKCSDTYFNIDLYSKELATI